MDKYQTLKDILDNSKLIVFFTGAGISTPSNIPDFRSSNGLYSEKYGQLKPETIISHDFFIQNTEEFYNFYFDKMVYPKALPNLAHNFIADLEKKQNVYVVTQNIDGLHQMAGSKNVIELHGSVYRNYCVNCHKFYSLNDVVKLGGSIPICPSCGGIVKPDVVLYEEQLDEDNIKNAINVISNADTLVVIGSSLVVYPAASFIRYFRGKHLICVNRDSTQYDSFCELVFHENVIDVVNKIK
ncbi:MAG: NAD-dependent protein deacylase [Bacilli bacterium]|nr:NAD-dependent protein deacylase [Bacilli bacterium]